MHATDGQLIRVVRPESLAEELDIRPGDRLVLLDGKPVLDIFDYRMRELAEQLILTVLKADGELIEFDVEKDEDESLGLDFDNPLMTECTDCQNRCVFCFIDQLPPGLRPSLYFKDDDLRLSFLTGNYVTLTNLDDAELDRLIACRFSPMNISVHTTDPALRRKMMRNRHAGNILERLQQITAAGIRINAQIVLCPGWNDGRYLDQTLRDLIGIGTGIQSIALVPVGVTRYRDVNSLTAMRLFTPAEAAAVIGQVEAMQQRQLAARDSRLVYAADEFYLRFGSVLPAAEAYEDYPQLENGVGMCALFLDRLQTILPDGQPIHPAETTLYVPNGRTRTDNRPPRQIILVTGQAAAAILSDQAQALASRFGVSIGVQAIRNEFFGETVTVAGLITGQDIVRQIRKNLTDSEPVTDYANQPELAVNQPDPVLVLPACMLKADEPVFLDDLSVQDVADRTGLSVLIVPADAEGLLAGLYRLTTPEGVH